MKRSSSADCNFIGLSLKRVKISTSPGELRLDRDIDSLISGKRWMSTANLCLSNNENHRDFSSDHKGSRIHVELYSHHARLVRDPVDPMRLRLTCLHQTTSSSNNYDPTDNYNAQRSTPSPLPPERWTFSIQVPRMYPHVPPAITRVTRDFVPNTENLDANLDRYNSSASAAMVASSVMQGHVEPPAPKKVLINLLPPSLHHYPQGGGLGDTQGFIEILDIDLATSVYNSWTPVSTLQDLLDFLIAMPARRWEWWTAENDRRRNHQQHQLGFFNGHPPAAQPTIAPATNSFSDIHQHQCQEHQQILRLSIEQESHQICQCEMDEDGELSNFESMTEDSPGFSGTLRTEGLNPFTANRFDVGYKRETNTRPYCEDVRHT
ncbi:hypothetical protein ACHAXA_004882 [Cyclostephanos tholiformis]|uniref:Uncharacterized protein n=1 Tax=Cyclostephanos tholiformis TaxID=382380 RepID=A0ABD3RRY4_9STRA